MDVCLPQPSGGRGVQPALLLPPLSYSLPLSHFKSRCLLLKRADHDGENTDATVFKARDEVARLGADSPRQLRRQRLLHLLGVIAGKGSFANGKTSLVKDGAAASTSSGPGSPPQWRRSCRRGCTGRWLETSWGASDLRVQKHLPKRVPSIPGRGASRVGPHVTHMTRK